MPRETHPAWTIATRLLAGERFPLEAKPISLPPIPCDNNEPEPDWHPAFWRLHGDGIPEREWKTLYESVQTSRIEDWEKVVRRFEANPFDLYNAWTYLDSHPVFWRFHGDGHLPIKKRIHERHLLHDHRFQDSVTMDVVKVNPDNQRWEKDPALNTMTQVWVEMGKWGWPGTETGDPSGRDAHWHDPDLDFGCDNLDLATIFAAIHIHTAYGNDRQICDTE
jgi:hypothetical protein